MHVKTEPKNITEHREVKYGTKVLFILWTSSG